MPMLIIECPATGKDLATGVVMDSAEFKVATISPTKANCPHCHHDHTWYKSDAFFKRDVESA